jgi:hypothetical protein
MGQITRFNAKKNYCGNEVIPAYGRYYICASKNPELLVAKHSARFPTNPLT